MTKQEKIASLSTAMISRKPRQMEKEQYYFSDNAPQELKDLYLEHYQVADIDYEIFNSACDIVHESYTDGEDTTDERVEDLICEKTRDSASYYTNVRLNYLTVDNEDEISETMRTMGEESIAIACALWYDNEVEKAAMLIKGWINK